jgi:cobalt-zinc-cadmium efflux system protein
LGSANRDTLTAERIKRLKIVFLLTAIYLAVEVIGALRTSSLALLADAGHMLTDIGGLALALFAISFARKPATPQRTYGFYRVEILASLSNSVILVLLSIFIVYQAYTRMFQPLPIESTLMTIIAVIGLAINLAGMRILGGHMHTHNGNHHHSPISKISCGSMDKDRSIHEEVEVDKSLNIEGVRLEILSDAIGSSGVIAAGIIISFTNFYWIDPVVSMGLAIFILPRTWSLINKSVHILMEGVPSNISYEEVSKQILGVKGVTGLFDLHIWTITSGMDALSAHVVILEQSRSQEILREITSILENRFRITHSTIQIETYHSQKDH